MSNRDDESEAWVGRRLKEARTQRRMTLTAVAERAGVSAAHLSRLEKGERQPSIGVLLELARTYHTSLGELLGEEPARSYHVTRAGSARTIDSPDGPYITSSGLGATAALSAVQLRLPAGTHNRRLVQHDGEEWLYVITGEIDVELSGERLNLVTGDALHFDARTPHRLTNAGSAIATVLIVSTPATTNHH